jgi:hypothetical protein
MEQRKKHGGIRWRENGGETWQPKGEIFEYGEQDKNQR